jgi:midasin (ATPase involved in ribosome maturation)
MNPANDAGKRELPPAIKARFTELFCGETTGREDLLAIVGASLAGVPRAPVADLVDFYLAARVAAETTLLDSAGQKPQYRCAAAPHPTPPRRRRHPVMTKRGASSSGCDAALPNA